MCQYKENPLKLMVKLHFNKSVKLTALDWPGLGTNNWIQRFRHPASGSLSLKRRDNTVDKDFHIKQNYTLYCLLNLTKMDLYTHKLEVGLVWLRIVLPESSKISKLYFCVKLFLERKIFSKLQAEKREVQKQFCLGSAVNSCVNVSYKFLSCYSRFSFCDY